MNMKKGERKQGSISNEDLAQMSQREFAAIRDDLRAGFARMATREELGGLNDDLTLLRKDMESGFEGVRHDMKAMSAQMRTIQEDVIELHDLRSRIERLEKKVGLRHS
jgi:hypothetical protein